MPMTQPTQAMPMQAIALLMEECLEAVTFGVLLLAENESVLFINSAAAKMLGFEDTPDISNHPAWFDLITSMPVQRKIRRALRQTDLPPKHFDKSEDNSDLDILASPTRDGGKFIFIQKKSFQPTDRFVARSQQLFGLTPQEARIAHHLSSGRCVEEIALNLNVQTNTVRMHLKRIYEKTNTNSQSQLVRRLVSNIFLS